MSLLFSSTSLTVRWNAAQVRHLLTPCLAGFAVDPVALRMTLKALSRAQLQILAESLWLGLSATGNRMLTKKDVARHAGMTVSWLDNSDSEKARKLRAAGIRYGKSQTSPVRYPLLQVIQICRQDESFSP